MLLYSGGIDSTVLAYMIQDRLHELFLFNYGQAGFTHQKELMEYHAKILDLKTKVFTVNYLNFNMPEVNKTMVDGGKPSFKVGTREEFFNLEEKEFKKEKFEDYLFGRNAMFTLGAGIYAGYRGYSLLYTGLQFEEFEQIDMDEEMVLGSDYSRSFFNTMEEILFQSLPKGIKIIHPLESMTKKEIIKIGKSLKVDLTKTYSCDYYPPCENCFDCQSRELI